MSLVEWLLVAAASEAARNKLLSKENRFWAWFVADQGLRQVGSYLSVRVLGAR